jgi:hypothetical protein
VLSLFDPKYRMWRQTTCLHSGYPLLLDRHWEEAVVGFIHHIIAYDKADEIRSEQNVHYYFASFVSRYNISGKKLLAQLKQKETSTCLTITDISSRTLLSTGSLVPTTFMVN